MELNIVINLLSCFSVPSKHRHGLHAVVLVGEDVDHVVVAVAQVTAGLRLLSLWVPLRSSIGSELRNFGVETWYSCKKWTNSSKCAGSLRSHCELWDCGRTDHLRTTDIFEVGIIIFVLSSFATISKQYAFNTQWSRYNIMKLLLLLIFSILFLFSPYVVVQIEIHFTYEDYLQIVSPLIDYSC